MLTSAMHVFTLPPLRSPPLRAGLLVITLILALLFGGCAGNDGHPVRKHARPDPQDTPFTGQWWEYYARGLAHVLAGNDRRATEDFSQAIEDRPDDQWHIRTTGSSLTDYFPHRELGILLYRQRRFEEAARELERSLDTAPSARARAWLTRTRGAIIKRNGSDLHPPELALNRSSGKKLTNAFSLVVRGRASDDTFLAAIRVGEKLLTLDPVVPEKYFEVEVPLVEGDNAIRVEAADLSGKSTVRTLELYRDLQGPQINIDSITAVDAGVTLKGGAADDTAVSLIQINRRHWPVSGRARGYTFNVLLPDGPITVLAGDRTGNITRAVVRHNEPDLLNDSLPDQDARAKDDGTQKIPPPDPENASTDTTGPIIQLRGLESGLTSFQEILALKGMVSDTSMVTALTLNNRSILVRNGRTIYFSLRRKLRPGPNPFVFQAEDEYGNKTVETIIIHRAVPEIMRKQQRLTLAVAPPGQRQPGSLPPAGLLQERLFDAFAQEGRFNLLPLPQMPTLPDDQGAFYLNPARAAELGRQLGVRAVLTTMLIRHREGVELVSRLVDTATGSIMLTNDAFSWSTDQEVPDILFRDLAQGCSREFPVIRGSITEVHENQVIIDAGARQGVRPGAEFICYRDIPPSPHPVTGQLLESEPKIIGILRVDAVYDDQARATFLKRCCAPLASDKVIAR